MHTIIENWQYNVLGIYNYQVHGAFSNYFDFLIENHNIIEGDVCEAGVYRGSSLLATGLLLKQLNSPKLVWGFDTFSGFPTYHPLDDLSQFDTLHSQNRITDDHYRKVKLNQEYRALALQNVTVANISTSGNFEDTSLDLLKRKIEYLELDNIRLIVGKFEDTMQDDQYPKFCAAMVDCDLYTSYQESLPFIWDRLAHGGYIHLDEYYSLKFPGARIATDEFFSFKKDKPQQHRLVKGEFERWFVRKIFE